MEKEQNALSIESGYLRINGVKKQLDRLSKKEKELAEQIGEEEAKEQIEAEREQLEIERRSADLDQKQTLLQKEMIEKQLKQLKVTSEVDGTVLEVNEEAVHVSGSQAEPQPIIRIAALDELVVEGVISEYDTLKVKEGQVVKLQSDVVPEQEWQGKVTHIGFLPQQNALAMGGETEAVQYAIEVSVEDQNVELKPGFQMIMEIETERKKVPTLPLSAIVSETNTTINVGVNTGAIDQTDEEDNIVYVVKDGILEARSVEVGMVSGDRIEITSGLEPDEQVVVDPADNLKDGMEVTVQ